MPPVAMPGRAAMAGLRVKPLVGAAVLLALLPALGPDSDTPPGPPGLPAPGPLPTTGPVPIPTPMPGPDVADVALLRPGPAAAGPIVGPLPVPPPGRITDPL